MNRRNRFAPFTIAPLPLIFALLFGGCGGVRAGNPGAPAPEVSLALDLGGNSSAALFGMDLCVSNLSFTPSLGGAPTVIDTGPLKRSIGATGVSLASVSAPPQDYSRVDLTLTSGCTGGKSLQISNSRGAFASSDTITVRFEGAFSVSAATQKLTFDIQPIANQLATVSNDASIKSAAESSSGALKPLASGDPGDFKIAPVYSATAGALASSSAVTVSGFTGTQSISISGQGSPELSVNGGAWGSSTTISSGNSLQVRLTADFSPGKTRLAAVKVGNLSVAFSVMTACPSGYVPAAAALGYTPTNFCVAKYEMKNVTGVATSQASSLPWTSINRNTAITQCQGLGANYDLISNSEWQTIARDVESQWTNWSGGVIGSAGGLNRGHSDNVPSTLLDASSDDTQACYGTGQTCSDSVWNAQRRTHLLSTGAVIWDLAGNASELLKDDHTTSLGSNGYMALFTDPIIKFTFGPAGDYSSLNTSPYGGLGYGWLNFTNGAILRGSCFFCGDDAVGIFRADLDTDPVTSVDGAVGFRCVHHP